MPIFTYTIIAVVVLITTYGFKNNHIISKFDFSIHDIIRQSEFYRIFTSQFFHVNWTHLLFNMFSFYSFSIIIELRYGMPVTALIYFASAIFGDFMALFMNRNKPAYRAVGASGAVCGIIFSSIFLVPGGSIIIFPIPLPLPSWLFAILFIAVSMFGIGRDAGVIGHEAHLGGALCGTVLSVILVPEILHNHTVLLISVTVPVILFIFIFNKIKQ